MNLKVFAASAIITTILIFSSIIIIVADFNTRKSGFGEVNPLFHLAKVDNTTYDVYLFGEPYLLNLSTTNMVIKEIQSNFALLPTPLYLVSQLYTSFCNALSSYASYVDEKNFINHVIDEINPYI